jgi:hypothetical protein
MVQLINLTTDKLQEIISEALKEHLKNIQSSEPQQLPEYITRKEASQMLSVSVVTLRSWHKKNVLIAHSIGKRVYYKLTDIQRAMKPNYYG